MLKPVIKRVDKFVPLPKAIRSVLKPIPQTRITQKSRVAQVPKSAQKPLASTPAVRLAKQQKVLSGRSNKTQRQRTPVIGINRKEPDTNSLRRIKEIYNSSVGRALAIVANGPSILEADIGKLRNISRVDIMSINRPDDRVWPTKYWLFCDTSQYHRHKDRWEAYNGLIFNTVAIPPHRNSIHIRHLSGSGFSRDLYEGFHIGRSSVFAAMQVALWLNFDMIYIFGVDMCQVQINGREMVHFYGANPDVQPDNRLKRFADEAKHYDIAASVLPIEIRQRFCFCSNYLSFPFADKFCRMNHKTAADRIIERWN